jgi:hypothetical protein
VARTFSLDEANALVPDIRERAGRLVAVRADLVGATRAHNSGQDVAIPDIKALEATMGDLLDGFRAWGLAVQGYAPLLLDFPSTRDGDDVFLCWLENEPEVAWFHAVDQGFMGRRPIAADQ